MKGKMLFWERVDELFKLDSSYSQRWYVFCIYNDAKIYPGITVENVRSLMSADVSEYKQKTDVHRRLFYEPVAEINLKTKVNIDFNYMHGSRRPVIGFNLMVTDGLEDNNKHHMVYSTLLGTIRKEYQVSDKLYQLACRYPLITAAMFQAHDKVSSGKVGIHISKILYMRKVILNTIDYMKPLKY